MRVASVTEVASDFAGYLKASEQGPVVVTRNGKPVAVLLRTGSQEDLGRLLMGHSPKLQAILEEARKRFRVGAGIPQETFWREVEAETVRKTKKPSGTRKNGRTTQQAIFRVSPPVRRRGWRAGGGQLGAIRPARAS